jgi:hypothetical protein
MDRQQILNYFGNRIIYTFNGNHNEFLSVTNNNSINYIMTPYLFYFISSEPVIADDRIAVFADNTQGAV